MNETYELIKTMICEFKKQRRSPLLVSMVDLIKRSGKPRPDVISELNKLAKAGKIRKRKSLNDNLIELL